MNTYRIEMRSAEDVHRFCNVVATSAETAETVACYYNAGYRAIWSSLLYVGGTWICARGEIGQNLPC
jgi:hypothetical protein